MNKNVLQYVQHSLVVLDIFILNATFFICWELFRSTISNTYVHYFFEYLIILNIFWMLFAWIGGLYIDKKIFSFESFSRRTTRIFLLCILFTFLYLYFIRKTDLSRLFFISSVIMFGVGLLLNRFFYLYIQQRFKKSNNLVKVLILGYNDVAKKLAAHFEEEEIATEIIGFAEDEKNVKELSNYPILSDVEHSIDISKQFQVDEIYSTITPEQSKNIYALMNKAESECIRFKIIPDLSLFIRRPIHIDFIGEIPVLSLRSEPLEDVSNRIRKRVFDIIISLFGILLVLSLLIPIIGLIIYLESPGPIFFCQTRTGKNNRNFKCIKFRSMTLNKESDLRQATRNDSRITKIGAFIRRTSIDEFPQLINVLKGDMSIVGPRPHMLSHTESFSKTINRYMVRQFLKPGITGWAQVNGFRGETQTLEQMQGRVDHDLWYLENWSLWLDVRIIFLTIFNVFKGDEHAY